MSTPAPQKRQSYGDTEGDRRKQREGIQTREEEKVLALVRVCVLGTDAGAGSCLSGNSDRARSGVGVRVSTRLQKWVKSGHQASVVVQYNC
eukprot:1190076-Prorocentrum_minimum.AAC.1